MSIKKKKIQKEKHDLNDIISNNSFKSTKLTIKNFNLTEKQKSFAQIAFDKNTKIVLLMDLLEVLKRFWLFIVHCIC